MRALARRPAAARRLPLMSIPRRASALALILAPLAVVPAPEREYGSPAALVEWMDDSHVHYIAHRGGCRFAPENTLGAHGLAVAWGARTIEVDVRTSADGTPWLMHDRTVDRTTDGTGPIADLTDAEVAALDAGSWMGPEFTGARVPTLEESLRWCKGRVRVYLDVKAGDLRAILDVVEACGMRDDVIFWFGAEGRAEELRALDPDVALKVNVDGVEELTRAALALGATAVEVDARTLSEDVAADAIDRGIEIWLYTKDPDQDLMERALECGVWHFNIDHPWVLAEAERSARLAR